MVVEERQETCSTVSKIVKIKIFRRRVDSAREGEIVGFDCAASTSSCETKCTFKLLMEDF
ncbi:hypothetical protein E4K67_21775 [Desulfosporosinus fructosivorans]|uniref:Uncharacterized protein n=1 Tax=Desulfosporosinus fructosivorans TaxID=2018669 RepID=A0A4Z0QZJ6_9FIRM|nr:hypothetical protein [Desulfosporosinus fructosivorans]TGE36221.1 hypothetical protein E4K67_21775 [Desulfosporosinus fructosivorans]